MKQTPLMIDIPRIDQEAMALEEVGTWTRRLINQHLFNTGIQPDEVRPVLLLGLPTGVGKTFIAAQLAEHLAYQQHRVLYLGPNHAFFDNLMAMEGRDTSLWLEWQPHQHYREEKGRVYPETCRHATVWQKWVEKGYESIEFCKHERVCGVAYMTGECVWHSQRQVQSPIVYGQYAHLKGIPDLEKFSLIIIDEAPFEGVIGNCKKKLKAERIVPNGINEKEPYYPILQKLAHICLDTQEYLGGYDLIEALGGMETVWEACQVVVDGGRHLKKPKTPDIQSIDDVDNLPDDHLFKIVYLLWREAQMLVDGSVQDPPIQKTNGLIYLYKQSLYYTFVTPIASEVEKIPVVCVDATCNPEMYQALFQGRPIVHKDCSVKTQGNVAQVVGKGTGITTLIKKKKKDAQELLLQEEEEGLFDIEFLAKSEQLREIISYTVRGYGYKRPAFISFKAFMTEQFFGDEGVNLHFKSQGDNTAKDCDALFIVGTPMPPRQAVIDLATAIWFEHSKPFDTTWSYRKRQLSFFDIDCWRGLEVDVGGFWDDHRLNSVLWQQREALLLQAVGRARLVLMGKERRGDYRHRCDVYLFSNIPLNDQNDEPLLKVDWVGDWGDLVSAPSGVAPYNWIQYHEKMTQFIHTQPFKTATVAEISTALCCSQSQARYIAKHLVSAFSADWVKTKVYEKESKRWYAALQYKH